MEDGRAVLRLSGDPRWRLCRYRHNRHTTATLLLRAGVPIQHVQRILRHSDIKLTVDTYGHMIVEDLRPALAALPVISHRATPARSGFVPSLSQDPRPRQNKALGALGFLPNSEGFNQSGRQDLNLRPLGPEPSALPG